MNGLVGDVLALLGLGFASALVPLLNIEVILAARAAALDTSGLWTLALVAAFGQMLGKLVWYYLGANALSWGWVRRRVETPKAQDRLRTWRTRTQQRPLLAGGLVLLSAAGGIPPLAIVAVLAGQLRMSVSVFFALGLLGRWLRFAAVLGGAGWLGHVFR